MIVPTTNNPLPTNLSLFLRVNKPNKIKIIAKGIEISPKPIFIHFHTPINNVQSTPLTYHIIKFTCLFIDIQ